MFKVRSTAHGYTATLEKTGDTYFIGNVKPTQGYPKKAKYPYKGSVSFMERTPGNTVKFHRLNNGDPKARVIISSILPEVCAYIDREKALEELIKQEENEQFNLLEEGLDDIIEGE